MITNLSLYVYNISIFLYGVDVLGSEIGVIDKTFVWDLVSAELARPKIITYYILILIGREE